MCNAPPGDLPPVAAGLTITKRPEDAAHAARPIVSGGLCRGLLVTAFGPNPYGEGTLLRLWEQVGMQGTVTVRLPAGFKARRVQPCDLRGQPLGPPFNLSQQGIFQLPIKPMVRRVPSSWEGKDDEFATGTDHPGLAHFSARLIVARSFRAEGPAIL